MRQLPSRKLLRLDHSQLDKRFHGGDDAPLKFLRIMPLLFPLNGAPKHPGSKQIPSSGMMKCPKVISWILRSLFFLAASTSAALALETAKIPPALQETLDEQGFVVTDTTYRQGFSAYLGGSYPAFITSDSILMAYTALLEKVVGEQQLSLMGAQIELVVEMAQQIPQASNETKGAKETRLFIGCAYRILLGVSPEGMTEEEGKLIELEARRVEKAEGDRPPDWWGSRDYLPYSRFMPTSTWDKSKPLQRYFRYYQWMQSLPLDGRNEWYLNSLMKLNEKPDQRAPKLFHSEAWQRKQLNCTMGAWAGYRHAVAITQTSSALWLSAFRQDPGYVEPVPEFFQTLGTAAEQLAGKSLRNRKQSERFQSYFFALKLGDLANTLRAIKTDTGGRGYPPLSRSFNKHEEALNRMFKKVVKEEEFNESGWVPTSKKDREELVAMIDASCGKFWAQDAEAKQLFARHAAGTGDDVSHRVHRLTILCLRLESLARKQLAGLERNDAEVKLIKDYGKTLGYLMFYEGNSSFTPRDDAPKIVQIAHLGQPGGEQVLQCGTARPRRLLIRYPNRKGEPVLCQGAVYAYRERIAGKPISNREWREQCKETSTPRWMVPVSDDLPAE